MGVIGFAGSLCGPRGLSIRTVLFYHFVVISQNQERCGPLTDKKRPVILLGDFENQGGRYRPDSKSQKQAGWCLGGLALDGAGEFVFGGLTAIDSSFHEC
jgi:hypothetical protein